MDSKIHLIGCAHLDPIWLWRWQDGCCEALQTFRSALDRLGEYPGFVFTCSSAQYYKWIEEIDPAMFREIAEMIRAGRWIPVGGWWIQPDCNIPSGESYARQALVSQLYYKEKFGRTCSTGYNCDSFGHNGNMPQLLQKGGMTSYVMMRPNDTNENPDMPRGVFWWDSPDGSRVLTFRIPDSYAHSGKNSLDEGVENAEKLTEAQGCSMMMFYGVGNHGGGPTRWDIEYLSSIASREGRAELVFSDPDRYFDEVKHTPVDLPVWRDDMQHHASGCYSATSMMKQQNRRVENLLYSSETFDTIASAVSEAAPSTAKFRDAWEKVCFNHFHDIMCGCSIMEAYEDVRDSEGYAATLAAEALNRAQLLISRRIDTWVDGVSDPVCSEVRHDTGSTAGFPRPCVLFNPLSWDVDVPVRIYQYSGSARDASGNAIPSQNVRSSRSNDSHLDTVVCAHIPAMGYATVWLEPKDGDAPEVPLVVEAAGEPVSVENEYVKAVFDPQTGGICSLVDKKTGHDYASSGILGIPTVIDDHETDTWAHNVFTFHKIKGVMKPVSVAIVESGPVRSVVRAKFAFGSSTLTEDFILAAKQRTLRVKCKAVWHEDFTVLKIPFDIGGSDPVNTSAIPSCFIKRECNGKEQPGGAWTDVTATFNGGRFGLTVLNDSKYSYDCVGTNLRQTVLRNVIFADHYSHRPPANFNFTDEGLQRFEIGVYLHEGECEDSRAVREAYEFNVRPTVVLESYHKGDLPLSGGFVTVDAPNTAVTALKYCEDGSGDLILRLYETAGKKMTRASVMSSLFDFGFYTDIRAHEIKTFRVNSDGKVLEVDFLEGLVSWEMEN